MIKKIKTPFIIILCIALVALIILLRLSAGNKPAEKEEVRAYCDYFNGEVMEITDTYFVLKPIAEWTWKETSRVRTPKTDIAQKTIDLKIGDLVRVAFNSKAMEWKEDEVLIPVAFAFYPLTEEGLAIQYEFASDDIEKVDQTDIVDDGEGNEKGITPEHEKLLPEGEVILINAFSGWGDYRHSFSDGESIKALKDYFDTLDLVSDFPEKPEDFEGGSWVLEFTYSDQRTETICHYGNKFVRNSNGKWYKMKYEQAAKLEELLGYEFPVIQVNDGEFNEIYEFMNYFMTFPVVWDFDQQNMSGAVDYFAQKWVWTDVTDLEYDVEANAFSADAGDFAEKMGQYFVMSDSAFRSIEEMTAQGRIKICADVNLPWFWGFSFRIDKIEVKEGVYYIRGYNAEVSENPYRNDDILLLGAYTDPFLEFNAVLVRDEEDGKLRLKELDGLKNGPGHKANVSQISDAEMKKIVEFAEIFLGGPVLEQYDVNNLSGVFDFAATKILETNPGAVRETDDGHCVVPLSVLTSYVDQHFYLPKGYEKCLPKEEGKNVYPCLAEDGVIFLKKENKEHFDIRSDLPVIQNGRYYRFGVYNVNAENLRSKLVSEGKDLSTINSIVKEQYPFELAVLCAVRGADGKLRLLYFTPYYL